MRKVLIIDDMHSSIEPMLMAIGWQANYRADIKRTEILEIIHDYEGLIVRSKTSIDKELIDKAIKLQWIGRAGAGMDQIAMDVVQQKNIPVINAPEGNRDAVGEHAIALLLSLFNKITTADLEIRAYQWRREANRGLEVMGKTVGLFGYGNMGEAFAKRLSGFGCKVIGYDKYKTDFDTQFARRVTEEELKQQTDILSLHVPLTSETQSYFNETHLDSYSKNIFIINTARGEILPLKGLVSALKSGKVKGAGLDVIENEKFDKLSLEQKANLDELIKFNNIVLSPHVAGWSAESYQRINQVLVEKLKRLDI